mgnify:CR=1 FL=1
MPDCLLVTVACPPEDAERLATLCVAQRLAACVSIQPGFTSVYRWQGTLTRSAESLLLIKTAADRFEPLREALLAAHPYELPEIVAVPVTAAHLPFLDWIVSETR